MSDPVMHPHHYSRWAMEPVEFIAINNLPWWMANVIKYIMREDAKDGLQDMYKARSYLDMKIRMLEGHPRFWEKPVSEQRQLSMEQDSTMLAALGMTFPDKALMPRKPAVFCAGTVAYAAGVEVARYCACGVNVTNPEFACWDDDCKHKQKTGGSIHVSDGELRRRQKDAGEGLN